MLFPEKAGGDRIHTGKHRAARTGSYLLLLWPAFNHIRRGGRYLRAGRWRPTSYNPYGIYTPRRGLTAPYRG